MSDQLLHEKKGVTPLDYALEKNWIINANADVSKKYDLIFFCGTSIRDSALDDGVGNDFAQMKSMGYKNYLGCGIQLSEDARIFCPVQRQMAMSYALSQYIKHGDIIRDIATKEPYIDLEAALDYYFEHYNPNAERPFVLAGHSQGAAAIQVCLGKYFMATEKRDYLKNMIAAYPIGYGVSKKYFDEYIGKYGIIHFARGEDDFNCVISWNTEGPGEKGPSFLLPDDPYDTYIINPLNWRTDETYAGIEENAGVLVEKEENGVACRHLSLLNEDLADGQIDLKRGSLICSTLTDYVKFGAGDAGVWGGKSLHIKDGRGYYNNMRYNLRLRVKKFFEAKATEK